MLVVRLNDVDRQSSHTKRFVPALALEYKLYFSRKSDRKSEVYRCTVRYRVSQNSPVAYCTETDHQTCGLRPVSHTVQSLHSNVSFSVAIRN